MTLSNMKAELRRFGITQKEVATALQMSENNFCLKINERIPMTLNEAKQIQRQFLPSVKLEYLIESDGDKPRTTRAQCHAYASAIGDSLRDAAPDDPEIEGIADMFHELAELVPDQEA